MSIAFVIFLVVGAAWVGYVAWHLRRAVRRAEAAVALASARPVENSAAEYAADLARMRDAVEAAVIETEPGGLTPDLTECWLIWPDAPHAPAAGP